ncbi:MAG: DoxX family protein [Deltaproteobacteria bacterium RIFCSPHIGHO2_02_FULL_40_11]|nr:MAG: DoxX family protein [Deltaproteobacteria bacterium RIFCSPHIGHO2_02_FULL_40_11]
MLSSKRDLGLLTLRLGIGIMFILHGYPKVLGGVAQWTQIGSSMQNLGITFFPAFWGFMAASSECFGGFLFAIGFLFRPACLLLLSTMSVATLYHLGKGDGIMGASHALEAAIVFVSMFLIGPGKHSFSNWFGRGDR